jgi:hypothetical protein
MSNTTPTEKTCTKCHTPKPATQEFFIKDPRNSNSIGGHCRECEKVRAKAFQAAHPDKCRARRKEYRQSHKKEVAAYNQQYAREHPAGEREKQKRYRAAHPEKVREMRRNFARKDEAADPLKYLWQRARVRADKEGQPFLITLEYLRGLYPDFPNGARCAAFPWMKLKRGTKVPTHHSPSLDKIIPELGYVPGNVAILSYRANRLKSDATLEELEALVAYIRETRSRLVRAA